MGSTIADILFLAVGVSFVVLGVKRGFLQTVIHFFKYILAFVFARAFGSSLGAVLSDSFIASPIKEYVYDRFMEVYLNEPGAFTAEKAIDALPSFLATDSVKEGLYAAQGSGEELLHNMTDAASAPVISVFSNIFGYILAFALSLILLWFVAKLVTKLIDKLQLFGKLNRLLGLLLGLAMGLTVMFAVSSCLRFFFATTDFYQNTVVVKAFGNSSFLHFLSFLDIGSGWLGL